ncbi:hypothetical protein RFM68_31235 [Mesorhizobium sp. MSK_1335]|uniref:Uncharacterized protein n=1 Tax=Mesorhizobium montanum TaxID=3072323 RepID=A0ABU4ZUA5_9HYPH|nr:hypothetical protein [Mesorhizobium sp. MSK_1335]MDX8528950.1 hypothetical protein [Mesorhizobium sp. MSK_1335]
MRWKEAAAPKTSAGDDLAHRTEGNRAFDKNRHRASQDGDEPLDDEGELVTSQNPSKRDIDEP